eukprot:TRINITY_DN1357_c0_g1_i1.p1 TRINITY_DN1357_c0_g1~~TRINITY_DN1357_c0_g1_i1.p1  ORF type:complete len:420 (+),score=50.30 TRINITY_DN1357_c0_g1_i1:82-1341(+)
MLWSNSFFSVFAAICFCIVSTDAAKLRRDEDPSERMLRYIDNFDWIYHNKSAVGGEGISSSDMSLLQHNQNDKDEKIPTIAFLGLKAAYEHETCPVKCNVRQGNSESADAVVINAKWSGPPPHPKKPNQVWVFSFMFEAQQYHGGPVSLSTVQNIESSVDYTMTFDPRSDFKHPIFYLARNSLDDPGLPKPGIHHYVVPKPAKIADPLVNRSIVPTSVLSPIGQARGHGKKKLLLWLVSNCGGGRWDYFKRLQQLLGEDKVDLLGGCGKPTCRGNDRACLTKLFKNYKFYYAAENSRCRGYITEKFPRGLIHGMVPIALGGLSKADYEVLAPPGSFVHTDDFGSVKQLADYLLKVDKDDELYNKFFEWKLKYHVSWTNPYCDLCIQLHKDPKDRLPTRTFKNLVDFWYKDSCRSEHPPI